MMRFSVSELLPADEPSGWGAIKRHQAKVAEAIRRNLADMVADEKVVISDGTKVLAVPVPEFQEFRIRFERLSAQSVGHQKDADGGQASDPAGLSPGAAGDKEGGQDPGADVIETEVTLEDVQRALFDRLELPDLDVTKPSPGSGVQWAPEGIGRTGITAQWDKKRTLKQALLRRAKAPAVAPALLPQDLRFRLFDSVPQNHGGAVVIAMMDTSGSMGTFEKYLAKSFFYWTAEFLRQKYPSVEMVFLAHDVRAREVDEDSFFHRGASGGTVSSSVYRLALEVIAARFSLERYNVYAFHFTDGGNLTSDNGLAIESGMELARRVTLFGYGEIHDTERNPSPLYQEFSRLSRVGTVILRRKEDIFLAMTTFFGRRGSSPSETERGA
jgi:sporulation protein YhbH